MMETVLYSQMPEAILYMALPDGRADVWLRQNIEQITDENDDTQWTADEVYFRTTLTEEEVTKGFDALFENGGPTIDEETGEESADEPTVAERVDALEAAVLELAELILEG